MSPRFGRSDRSNIHCAHRCASAASCARRWLRSGALTPPARAQHATPPSRPLIPPAFIRADHLKFGMTLCGSFSEGQCGRPFMRGVCAPRSSPAFQQTDRRAASTRKLPYKTPIRLAALSLRENRAIRPELRPICCLHLILGRPAMVCTCTRVLSDDHRAGDRTLFERHGVMCFSHDHATAIVPSMLNPVFETVTGEAPASFSLSPRPDDTRTC